MGLTNEELSEDSRSTSTFILEKEEELRFEVESNSTDVHLELIDGTAEIFGSPIVKEKAYIFQSQASVAVYSFNGATVTLSGNEKCVGDAYVSKDTPNILAVNIHGVLENMRDQAAKEGKRGPCVMVVGSLEVGKTVLCRQLINWAVRSGRAPTLIDLDVSNNSIAIPGTICALTTRKFASPVNGWDRSEQIVYHYGHTTLQTNPDLYNTLVLRLSDVWDTKCSLDQEFASSGCVIDTSAGVKGENYEAILNICKEYGPNVVVCVNNEMVYNKLRKALTEDVELIKFPRSTGVQEKSRQARMDSRYNSIHKYFYGSKDENPLFPHTVYLNFDDIMLYRIGIDDIPESCLPSNYEEKEDKATSVMLIEPTKDIVNCLLSVSLMEDEDECLSETNIGLFLVVQDVDVSKRVMKVMSPITEDNFPSKYLLVSNVRFVEKS